MGRAYTQARKQSNLKWDSENLERLNIAFTSRGNIDRIKAAVAVLNAHLPEGSKQMSMNQFIKTAIEEKIATVYAQFPEEKQEKTEISRPD